MPPVTTMMDYDRNHKRGLAGSRWATQTHTTPSTPTYRLNASTPTRSHNTSPTRSTIGGVGGADWDWDCSACGFDNFGWRKECLRCQKPKDSTKEMSLQTITGAAARFPPLSSGYSTPLHNGTEETVLDNGVSAARGALAMSRWAPRNRAAMQKYGDKTWTRITHVTTSSALINTETSHIDLGLPYEVQHYILSLLQTILEEACFALASRWLPTQLAAKNWSCSEAVELSVWRDFLPSNLPSSALHDSDVSLEQGLQDAVRIRNKAVHRHLVDNDELRNLCWRGERLMVVFGDVSRREKCHRLWEELDRWDLENVGDMDAKKRVLENALMVIGEKPVADMDWTPNEVSLAEITEDEVQKEVKTFNGVYGQEPEPAVGVEDAMELD